MTIQENVPLAPLTTLRVGGEARYFAEIRREDELSGVLEFAKSRELPIFILGGGSNLLVADSGWPGLVLKIAIGGIATPNLKEATGNSVLFTGGAGVSWDDFVAQAVVQNCGGVECLSGIPGSVGGTPVQNVGAYGQEVSDTIESVRALDLKTGLVVHLPRPVCVFRYRGSIFNTSERGRYIILRVNFRLKRGGPASLKYADLQKYFADKRTEEATGVPSLADVREAVREIRRSKGMLIVAGDEDCRSAGSFFKNPVLSEERLHELKQKAAAKELVVPSYPALDSQHKVSAAWLVENSGFAKGYVSGRAGISRKHALALINREDASAADILHLKNEIQVAVKSQWAVTLEPEPVFLGFDDREK